MTRHADESDAAFASGDEQLVMVADVEAVGVAEVLGEETGAEESPRGSPLAKMALDLRVRDVAAGAVPAPNTAYSSELARGARKRKRPRRGRGKAWNSCLGC